MVYLQSGHKLMYLTCELRQISCRQLTLVSGVTDKPWRFQLCYTHLHCSTCLQRVWKRVRFMVWCCRFRLWHHAMW